MVLALPARRIVIETAETLAIALAGALTALALKETAPRRVAAPAGQSQLAT